MLNSNQVDYYDKVKDEIKFITNSKLRLKILTILFESPSTMKEIHSKTSLSYSSISSNLFKLELKELVYRFSNKYFLNNIIKLYLMNLLDFNKFLLLLNDFADFFIDHNIKTISLKSISNLYLLEGSQLIESNGYDIYKTYNIIQKILKEGNYVKIILPFIYSNFIEFLSKSKKYDIKFEIIVSKNIFKNLKKEIINRKISNVKLIESKRDIYLSLFISDNKMALGLYKNDNLYDSNRLLFSNSKNSLIWAENLYNHLKNEII